MCRWLAYCGTPILLDELLYKPKHSLIDQSLHSRLMSDQQTTNGDGFGIGWYTDPAVEELDPDETPAVFRGVEPAWSNRNLRDLAAHVRSSLFFAHIRAASPGTASQETNCHPFRCGKWLWMHNGEINGFTEVRRDLMLAVDPTLFPLIDGTTDTEVMFYLALTFGLVDDVPGAVERMIHLVEATAMKHGVAKPPLLMTLAVSDGFRIWAFRYATEGKPPSLFYSTDPVALQRLHPENDNLKLLSAETSLVVSEPLNDLSADWTEVKPNSYLIIENGQDQINPLTAKPA
ncbi:class II glutamine amidotransferase [Kitasatospora acidiphila]|uniref:class II glutamine amidotransferase n=1 Tax=Kitasatospora acidiphila TaxID=2567942 RepID=UPI003C73F09B